MNRSDFNTKFLNYLNLKSTFTINFSVKTIRLKKFSQIRVKSCLNTLCLVKRFHFWFVALRSTVPARPILSSPENLTKN